jgi:hypothetical protein
VNYFSIFSQVLLFPSPNLGEGRVWVRLAGAEKVTGLWNHEVSQGGEAVLGKIYSLSGKEMNPHPDPLPVSGEGVILFSIFFSFFFSPLPIWERVG